MTIQKPIAWQASHIATMDPERPAAYGAVHDGVIVTRGELIEWVGERESMPASHRDSIPTADWRMLPEGYWVTPGLVDCHTHIVYGGNRSGEFEQRLTGVTYAEIARQGGGIVSTVRATRAATHDQLVAAATPRLERLLEEGVTTLEIKSGYGLDIETELTMLRVARELGTSLDVSVVTTHLGAHTLPPEFADRADAYIDRVCLPSIKAAADEGLADAVDAFCESIGFDLEQTRRVFDAAAQANLPVKLHSEQLSNLGGTRLACEHHALSVDHLEYLDQQGIEAMARSGTVAVLLPGAFYFLRETRVPPMDLLREFKIPMAIASDCNPGSSPVTSLLLMLNMGCTLFALTPEEALAGVTRNGARALGLKDRGIIRAGMRADLSAWEVDQPADLAYGIGHNPCRGTLCEGRIPLRSNASTSRRTQAFST